MTEDDVQFAEALAGLEQSAFRSKLGELALQTIRSPLYVDTVFAAEDRALGRHSPFPESFWCLLLDVHRSFLFYTSRQTDSATIRSIARFVMDEHRSRGEETLAAAVSGVGYR